MLTAIIILLPNTFVRFSDPLSITCPSDLEVTAPDLTGATVTFQQPTTSGGYQPSSITCDPSSGSLFRISTQHAYLVTCTVTDARSNKRTCSFSVQVYGKFQQYFVYSGLLQ